MPVMPVQGRQGVACPDATRLLLHMTCVSLECVCEEAAAAGAVLSLPLTPVVSDERVQPLPSLAFSHTDSLSRALDTRLSICHFVL